jgi:arsenate reductase
LITIYGIRNCDTMKKAVAWLDGQGIPYRFHDYRKDGIDRARLSQWCAHVGWEGLVNRRGTTWRRLAPAQQAVATQAAAIGLMLENPSLIKRPVVERGARLLVGFDPGEFAKLLK